VVITTYNRCEALEETLAALARQTLSPERYEVLVVDNGCTDGTASLLDRRAAAGGVRVVHLPANAGIGGARNAALRLARGQYVIFVSDDVLVPEDFITVHVSTLEQFPGFWVVGRTEQLAELDATPFGRYLSSLEGAFDRKRRGPDDAAPEALAPGIWVLEWPTARNLSLPRADLDRIGLFDEQFRNACEDQDLALRARWEIGVRFLLSEQITCVHNDQAADLARYCRAQERGAHDTALFCRKYRDWYAEHGVVPIMTLNAPLSLGDGPRLALMKLLKMLLGLRAATALVDGLIRCAESLHAPFPILARLYQTRIGISIRRGWRNGQQAVRCREAEAGARSPAI
jgi:GT2 family glycosyltransferase